LGAEAGQSGLIGTAVVARALEAERVREHTHDLFRRPPPVSLRYAWHEGIVVVFHNKNPPTPFLWQAPASTQKTKKENQARGMKA